MENKKKNPIASVILTIVCILWMYPIVLILFNALKKESAITTSGVFSLPSSGTDLPISWPVLLRWTSLNPSGTVL